MTDWREGFKRALIDVVVAHGSPVRERPDFFGWEEYPTGWGEETYEPIYAKKDHIALVGIDYSACTYEESVWDEFMGTFYEGDTRVYGVDAWIVCLDGQRFHWRWKGTASDLIQSVLMDTGRPDVA